MHPEIVPTDQGPVRRRHGGASRKDQDKDERQPRHPPGHRAKISGHLADGGLSKSAGSTSTALAVANVGSRAKSACRMIRLLILHNFQTQISVPGESVKTCVLLAVGSFRDWACDHRMRETGESEIA